MMNELWNEPRIKAGISRKDENEAENVRKIIGDREVFQVHRGVDANTFQPILYFAIPEKDKPFFYWVKYAAPMSIWSLDDKAN